MPEGLPEALGELQGEDTGLGLLARLLLSQLLAPSLLTIGRLEQGVSRLLGSNARAVGIRSEYPEIGTDIDKPEDVAIARRLLATKPLL